MSKMSPRGTVTFVPSKTNNNATMLLPLPGVGLCPRWHPAASPAHELMMPLPSAVMLLQRTVRSTPPRRAGETLSVTEVPVAVAAAVLMAAPPIALVVAAGAGSRSAEAARRPGRRHGELPSRCPQPIRWQLVRRSISLLSNHDFNPVPICRKPNRSVLVSPIDEILGASAPRSDPENTKLLRSKGRKTPPRSSASHSCT